MTEIEQLKAKVLLLESVQNAQLHTLKEVFSKKDKVENDLWIEYITKVNSKFKNLYSTAVSHSQFSESQKKSLIDNQPTSVVLDFQK